MKTLWLIVLIGCAGCTSTVTPRIVTDNVPSWDGTHQNSGLRFFLEDGSMAITPNARNRYNGLILIYADRFIPSLTKDAGISIVGTNIVIDPEHMEKWSDMNRWRKSTLQLP